jgi:DNA-binding Lrp family transcriptional regulator
MKGTEWKLLSELMKNSRRSPRELAKAVGVSQPTIHRMIKKLEKEGYIREYTVIPDFAKLGYEILALTFVKLKKTLSAEEIEKARKVSQKTLKTSAFECVMIERGLGMGYSGVFISFHKDYASHLQFKKWITQYTFLDIRSIDSYIISLNDKIHYRPLTFSTLAKHLLMQNEKKE